MALNPIRFADQVNDQFRKYQLTAFPIADPSLGQQARDLLGRGGFERSPLVQGPYLSLARAFEAGASFSDLVDAGVIHPALAGIAQYPAMFAHQHAALEAVKAGDHVLVSTGTGSGKTEAFLYPIADHCLRLRDERAPAGVVAILVYPMNALAADQRDRLRSFLAGTGITYGMYVGSTPRAKEDAQVMRLGKDVDKPRFEQERVRRRAEGVEVVPYEECPSEEEIAARKPRILITNANQLEILLTRARDLGLFTDAPLRFLVLDEAHTYSGAVGAEVATLVRRLRAFCHKRPDEVTCIATSATIVDPERGTEVGPAFLARLCGVPEGRVRLVSEKYEEPSYPGRRVIPGSPADPDGVLEQVLDALEGEDRDAVSAALEALTGEPLPQGLVWEALYDHLHGNEAVRILAQELVHPLHLDEAVRRLWRGLARTGDPSGDAGPEVLAYLALGAAAEREGSPLLRPKMHLFIRGLEGAAVAFEGDPLAARLYFSAEKALLAQPERLPSAIFPLSVCQTCGQHYLTAWLRDFDIDKGQANGGDAVEDAVIWQPVGEEEGARVRFTDRFLVEADEDQEAGDHATERLDRRRVPAWLCSWCGTFHRSERADCANPVCRRTGGIAAMHIVIETKGFTCPGCGAHSGGRRYEPIRPVRAVSVADVHILAQEMITSTPSDDERRLLIFADNRQDAAFQAGWMRDHARRYRLRYLMLEAIRASQGPISVGDLHEAFFRRLRDDRELAVALAPEAFRSEDEEAFGNLERQNLSRFLRVQLIRELTPRMNQRTGLEPWGQIELVYAGLDPADADLQELASSLVLEPESLVHGISTLLDMWRRAGLFHDAVEPIYGRWWREGDEDILRGLVPSGLVGIPPKGVKLRREEGDEDRHVVQVISARAKTSPMDFVGRWGVADPRAALESIWWFCTRKGLLERVTLTGAKGGAVAGALGVYQVPAAKIGIIPENERFRCTTCQRVHARPTPGLVCSKRYCAGTLKREEPASDHYDVSLLDRPFSMVMAEEHSAQVPPEIREEIEREFKKTGGRVNTLVATPTLELGVDIGDLDLVLLRNVPPTPANYWQRVGRAGRRRRMAVLYTYCRRAIHDAYFFEDPARLLAGMIRPPRFNMKNDVLVAKHVHATVISELLRRKRSGALTEEEATAVTEALPLFVRGYLLEGANGHYRQQPLNLSGLSAAVASYRDELIRAVTAVFGEGWPNEAAEEVAADRLAKLVDGMGPDLQDVVDRLHQRFQWTKRTRDQLNAEKATRPLDKDEEQQLRRCEAYLGQLLQDRRETYTLSVLASEGFLPGYGMYEGGVTAFAGRGGGQRLFELRRPTALAVREYVPGNMVYANRGRFRATRYHFPIGQAEHGQGVQTEKYIVDVENEKINIAGSDSSGYGSVADANLDGLTICDVDLTAAGRIHDEETERFQLPVVILGLARRHRRGGAYYRGGAGPIRHLYGQALRLVNVGPTDRVRDGEFGYPVCRVCGAARSPYAIQRDLDNFAKIHKDRCGVAPERIAFSSDATVDALHFQDLAGRSEAANLAEALRVGASRVLEMEPEDLQILITPDGPDRADLYLYDPMPGGSGLLSQILDRWEEIVDALGALLGSCPAACERSCYECLRTGRNVYYHRLLDRAEALDVIERFSVRPEYEFDIPQIVESGFAKAGSSTVTSEDVLRHLLDRGGFEGFVEQLDVPIGQPYKNTVPDFAFVDEDADIKVAVYLDGIVKYKADPNRERQERIIRDQLEDLGWTVISILTPELNDPEAMLFHFKKIARAIGGRERAQQIEKDRSWQTTEEEPAVPPVTEGESVRPVLRIVPREEANPYVTHLPVLSLEAAAGAFLENAPIEEEGWIAVPGVALREGMFVAAVRGHSMEPRIPDGALVVFRRAPGGGPVAGSRDGRIVLAVLHNAEDPEGGGSYTVKRFESTKRELDDGRVVRDRIVLRSLNREIHDVKVASDQDVAVVAEFVRTLDLSPQERG